MAFSTSYSEVLICSVPTRFPYCGILMFLEQKSSIPKINWYSPMPKKYFKFISLFATKIRNSWKNLQQLVEGTKIFSAQWARNVTII